MNQDLIVLTDTAMSHKATQISSMVLPAASLEFAYREVVFDCLHDLLNWKAILALDMIYAHKGFSHKKK